MFLEPTFQIAGGGGGGFTSRFADSLAPSSLRVPRGPSGWAGVEDILRWRLGQQFPWVVRPRRSVFNHCRVKVSA